MPLTPDQPSHPPILNRLNPSSDTEKIGYGAFLILSKVLDARRRGATTEAYGIIRRKPAPAKAGGEAIEGNAADDALMVDQGIGSRAKSL